MPHDPAFVAETQAWLRKARADLDAGAFELTAEPPFTADIAFHAQQAAEKTIKAFLTWHAQTFRKTHNLVELGQSCAEIDGSLEPSLRRSASLTEYAWKFRYPGESEDPTRAEAEEALAVARELYESILARLPEEVRLSAAESRP